MSYLDKTLHQLGWRRVDLARRLGIWPETISRWNEPPEYVRAYLDAMLALQSIRKIADRELSL